MRIHFGFQWQPRCDRTKKCKILTSKGRNISDFFVGLVHQCGGSYSAGSVDTIHKQPKPIMVSYTSKS